MLSDLQCMRCFLYSGYLLCSLPVNLKVSFFPTTKAASFQQQLTDPYRFICISRVSDHPLLLLLGSPVKVMSYFLQQSSCNFLIM